MGRSTLGLHLERSVPVIRLTRLNGSQFYLNADRVQTVEETPDTHVLLDNGQTYLVRESADEVAERATEYQRRVRVACLGT